MILDIPLRYAWFQLKGMIRFFIDPLGLTCELHGYHTRGKGIPYYPNAQGLRGVLHLRFSGGGGMSLLLGIYLLANFLKTGGLLLFFLDNRVDLHLKIFLLLLIISSPCNGPPGASRFAMPLVPLIIFMALAQGNFTLPVHRPKSGRRREFPATRVKNH